MKGKIIKYNLEHHFPPFHTWEEELSINIFEEKATCILLALKIQK
jgi:hypothetical protein